MPEDVKRRRNNELLAVQQEVSAANNREMVGKTVEVMVEGESKLVSKGEAPIAVGGVELGWEKRGRAVAASACGSRWWAGRAGDQVVVFDGDASLKGQLLDVEICGARNLTLFGRPVCVPA